MLRNIVIYHKFCGKYLIEENYFFDKIHLGHYVNTSISKVKN